MINDFILGLIIGAMIAGCLLCIFMEPHALIIKHNCASYDSQTGAFRWNDEEKK